MTPTPKEEQGVAFQTGSYSLSGVLWPTKETRDANRTEGVSQAIRGDWTAAEERRLLWKIDLRVMTITSLMYILSYIDRGNLGGIKTFHTGTPYGIEAQIGTQGTQYNWAISILFFSVLLFQIPGTLLVKRYGGRFVLSAMCTLWGVICMTGAAVKNPTGLFLMRWFLGIAEANLVPGSVFYFSYFYTNAERAKRLGIFTSMSLWSGAFSGFVNIGIDNLNRQANLSTWQWVFLLEGLPAVVIGLLSFVVLYDYPGTSRCQLSEREQHIAMARLSGSASRGTDITFDRGHALRMACRPSTYLFPVVYFCVNLTQGGLGSFLPSILINLGYTTGRQTNLYAALNAIWGGTLMILWCAHSDWTRERVYHGIGGALFLGFPGAVILVYAVYNVGHVSNGIRYFATFLMVSNGVDQPIIQTLRMSSVSGATEAAIASGTVFLGLTISNIVAPQLYPNAQAPLYKTGLLVSNVTLGLGIFLYLLMPALLKWERRTMYGPNCAPWARKFQSEQKDDVAERVDEGGEKGYADEHVEEKAL